MKEKCMKTAQMIFAWGMSVLMAAGLVAAIIYLAALILGQPASVAIHHVMQEYVLPVIYYAGILLSFDGMVYLYLKGERLFCLEIPKVKGGNDHGRT